MRRYIATPSKEGHYDFQEVNMVREFSWRYKSLFGAEGTWNGDNRQFVIRIVLVGLTIGITGGVSIGANPE